MLKRIDELNFYELLEIEPSATPQDIHRAYDRIRKVYDPNSIALYSLFSPEETATIRRKIEDAYRTLMHEKQRNEYDHRLRDQQDLPELRPIPQPVPPLRPAPVVPDVLPEPVVRAAPPAPQPPATQPPAPQREKDRTPCRGHRVLRPGHQDAARTGRAHPAKCGRYHEDQFTLYRAYRERGLR